MTAKAHKKQTRGRTPSPASYRSRTYRHGIDPAGLVPGFVRVGQTDLQILATTGVEEQALHLVHQYRNQLENYIAGHHRFLTSLEPLPVNPLAPTMVKQMLNAAIAAGVGPMAAVAGAIAEMVGHDLLAAGIDEIIIENGGDIFIQRRQPCVAAIFAGQSTLNQQLGIQLTPACMPLGICTSSATVGHSLSFGSADSVTVLASSTALADAAATRLGNEVTPKGPISRALDQARTIPGLLGVVIIRGDQIGAWGQVELVRLP